MTNHKILVSKREAAEMLSISVRVIERLIRRGDNLKSCRLAGVF